MANCTVYIDEAGDLGFNRGTKWFVLSAVIVLKSDETAIRQKMATIKTRLNVQEIHLRKITDFQKRAFAVRELSGESFIYTSVVVDTSKLDAEKIPNPLIAYNYVCKILLQKVSAYLSRNSLIADVVLSARGTSRDGELITYINEKLLPYPANHINSACFEKISAKTASQWDLLQLADVCATSMFLAHEVNGFGFVVPCYRMALEDHVIQVDGRIQPYGLYYFTKDMIPDLAELDKLKICAKKERTPGATTT